jgi:hypothetical protein
MEREKQVHPVIVFRCSECDSTLNKEDIEKCPFDQLRREFNKSNKTASDLDRLVRKYELSPILYSEEEGVPRFICPKQKGYPPGTMAIFSSN